MTEAEIVDCVRGIRRARRGGVDAPHKPMLLLLALRLHREGVTDIPFATVDAELGWLLREFNTPGQVSHPYLPFWHLAADCGGRLWEVRLHDPGRTRFGRRPHRPYESDLRAHGATGRLGPGVLGALGADPALGARLADAVLRLHFPAPLHAPLLEATGMGPAAREPAVAPGADPAGFRRGVLLAYNSQCAICDFTVAMRDNVIALEAAHIRWRSWDGPDIVTNGIALCANHHRMFDRGVFTIEGPDRGYAVRVSGHAQFPGGIDRARRLIDEMRFSPPLRAESNPDPLFLEWHRDNVFGRAGRAGR